MDSSNDNHTTTARPDDYEQERTNSTIEIIDLLFSSDLPSNFTLNENLQVDDY